MWAYRLERPMCFARHEIDAPPADSLASGEVLIRFLAGGICGSDVPRCRDGPGPDGVAPYGLSLHEIVGEVVESRSDLEVGERVVGWVSDSRGLTEYVVTAGEELVPVEAALDHIAAVTLQPLACVLHSVSQLPRIRGRRIAVIGLGPIGLLFAHALREGGAASVHGVDAVDRGDTAATFGLDGVEHSTSHAWSLASDVQNSFDLVIEAVGHQVGTLDDAITAAASGGTIVCFGNPDDGYYPIRFGTLMDKNLTLRAGRTPIAARRDALRLAQEYVAKHPALPKTYVTHVLPVSDAQTAYDMASRPTPGQLKIVLDGTA